MNIEQLSAFVTTAETGSFSAAARRLGKSMPTISQLVGNLEIDLNLELFDRSGRYPSLTSAGIELYDYAKYSVDSVSDITLKARSLNAGVENSLQLGIESALYDNYILPQLSNFHLAFPQTNLSFIRRNTHQLRTLVIDGTIDLALGYIDTIIQPSEYHSHSFAKDTIVAVIGEKHALVGKTISYSQLNQQLQLSFSIVESIEGSKHGKPLWLFEHPGRLKEVLHQGIGWAFVPKSWVKNELSNGQFKKLQLDFLHQDIHLEIELMTSKTRAEGPALTWWKDAILASVLK